MHVEQIEFDTAQLPSAFSTDQTFLELVGHVDGMACQYLPERTDPTVDTYRQMIQQCDAALPADMARMGHSIQLLGWLMEEVKADGISAGDSAGEKLGDLEVLLITAIFEEVLCDRVYSLSQDGRFPYLLDVSMQLEIELSDLARNQLCRIVSFLNHGEIVSLINDHPKIVSWLLVDAERAIQIIDSREGTVMCRQGIARLLLEAMRGGGESEDIITTLNIHLTTYSERQALLLEKLVIRVVKQLGDGASSLSEEAISVLVEEGIIEASS